MKLEVSYDDAPGKSAVHVRVAIDPSEVHLVETPFGVVVDIDGFQRAGEIGGPALPAKTIHLALPGLSKARGVSVKVGEPVALTSRAVAVTPLQPARPGVAKTPEGLDIYRRSPIAIKPSTRRPIEKPLVAPLPAPAFVPPKPELYARAQPAAELVSHTTVGLASIASVVLRPVQIDQSGRLVLLTSFVLHVEHAPAGLPFQAAADRARSLGKLPSAKITSQAQARRAVDLARQIVINPDLVERIDHLFPPSDVEYVIVTDNQRWDRDHMVPTGPAGGDLAAAFRRLVSWKRSRGLTARVVTITSIMNGTYGDFRTGARDLQEVIRNFLKHAHASWGTAWVLLGGDIDVVPVRRVAGVAWGQIGVVTAAAPDAWQASWSDTYMRLHLPGLSMNDPLLRYDTGQVIPHDPTGTSSATVPGWYYTTDATYATRSATATEFIRVNGPAAEVNGTLYTVRYENLIPTDLYYASLVGPSYGVPGTHDWDLLDNGVYGQHKDGSGFDGVEYATDVSVGRAPAATGAEADAFVSKVIAYEQFRAPDGAELDPRWPERMVIGSSNWGGRIWIGPTGTSPPGDNQAHHTTAEDHTLIKLADPPSDMQWHLIVQVDETDLRVLPYATTGRGWYFANSATLTTPSQMLYAVAGMTFQIPIPTRWVVVRSTAAEELSPQGYVFDRMEKDGSLTDQEQLRVQIQGEISLTQLTRIYEDDVDLTPADLVPGPVQHLTEAGMREAMSAGPHFVSLSGHGWWGGCCGLSPTVSANVTNGYHTFVVYADSCCTNELNHAEVDGNHAVSEQIVVKAGAGAVAYVGNSRFSWIGVGDNFQRAFFHRLATTRHLGTAFDVRCTLFNEWTGGYQFYNTWTMFSLNLLGDPEMPLWVGPPRRVRIDIPRFVPRRKPFPIPVEILGKPGDPGDPEVWISARQGDRVKTALVNEKGVATLDLAGFEAGEVEIVAAGRDVIPFIARAEVEAQAKLRGRVIGISKSGDGRIAVRLEGDARTLYVDAAAEDRTALIAALRKSHEGKEEVGLLLDAEGDGATIERVTG